MPFLPIAHRELLVGARRRATYRIRFWAVLAALIAFGWRSIAMSQWMSSASQGRELFFTLFVFVFCFALSIGIQTTSDSLSSENREGTLGLLFLTDLKPFDVVIGKLLASSVAAAYGLIAMVPILAIPILMGGVTIANFIYAVVAVACTMFVSLAAGMVSSVYNRNERKAAFYTVVLLLVIFCSPLLVAYIGSQAHWIDERNIEAVVCFSPLYLLMQNLHQGSQSKVFFWTGVFATLVWTCVLLRVACRRLPLSWQDRNTVQRVTPLKRSSSRALASKVSTRRRLLNLNPFLWLSFRQAKKNAYAWLFLISMLVIWAAGFLNDNTIMLEPVVVIPLILMINGFYKVWVAIEACQQLIEARRSGALELLLSTPLTDQDIIGGQWLALRKQFGLPLVCVGVVECLFIFLCHAKIEMGTPLVASWIVVLFFDVIAIGWVGMWMGLTAKNTTRAIVFSAVLLLAAPWLIFYGLGLLVEYLSVVFRVYRTGNLDDIRWWMLVAWLLINAGFIYCVGFAWARRNVIRKFRLVATEQYQIRKSE